MLNYIKSKCLLANSRISTNLSNFYLLTADKGVAMVTVDREDYTDKAHLLLADTNTYEPIPKDPMNKLKNKLPQTLRDIKNQGRSQ